MVHKGTTREPKRIRMSATSTVEDKLLRHRNKMRIWRRAIARMAPAES